MPRCSSTTKKGTRCRNNTKDKVCRVHSTEIYLYKLYRLATRKQEKHRQPLLYKVLNSNFKKQIKAIIFE